MGLARKTTSINRNSNCYCFACSDAPDIAPEVGLEARDATETYTNVFVLMSDELKGSETRLQGSECNLNHYHLYKKKGKGA